MIDIPEFFDNFWYDEIESLYILLRNKETYYFRLKQFIKIKCIQNGFTLPCQEFIFNIFYQSIILLLIYLHGCNLNFFFL